MAKAVRIDFIVFSFVWIRKLRVKIYRINLAGILLIQNSSCAALL